MFQLNIHMYDRLSHHLFRSLRYAVNSNWAGEASSYDAYILLFQDFYERFWFKKHFEIYFVCLPLKMLSISLKITLMPFKISNFSWETDKLNFKTFCRKKNFRKNPKKSRAWALISDKNSRRYLKSVLSLIFRNRVGEG